jgi:predicted Zn-dependent peptidase
VWGAERKEEPEIMSKPSKAALALAGALLAGSAAAAVFRVPIEQYTLDNGLKVILSEDHASPVVAVAIYYHVGSRDEEKGRSGFAHLFEHMMFQGSANVKKGEFFQYVENNGGELNGSTHDEYTNYFEMMPSDRLELALWLEADRMRSLDVSTENLKNQQEVVKEEKRLRVDNQPYIPSYLKLSEMLFRNWANAHSTIGSMEDLDAAQLQDVRNFFRIHYAPNNAVLVVAGDFDPKEARGWIEKHFGSIPRQAAVPRVDTSETPGVPQERATVVDTLANVPALLIGWKVPGLGSPESPAIDLLSTILGDGDSSLLYQTLVKEKQMAVSVEAGYDEDSGPSTFSAFIVLRPRQNPGAVSSEVEKILSRIQEKGVTAEELARAKALSKSERFGSGLRSLQTPLGRAMALGWAATFAKDGADDVNQRLARYEAVTAAEIQEAARKCFTPQNRSTIVIEVPPKAPEKGEAR